MTREFFIPGSCSSFQSALPHDAAVRFQEVQLISPQVVMGKKLSLCSASHWITTVMLLTGCWGFFSARTDAAPTQSHIPNKFTRKLQRTCAASSCRFLIDTMHRLGNAAGCKHMQIFNFFLNNPSATSCHVHLQSKRLGRGPCFV